MDDGMLSGLHTLYYGSARLLQDDLRKLPKLTKLYSGITIVSVKKVFDISPTLEYLQTITRKYERRNGKISGTATTEADINVYKKYLDLKKQLTADEIQVYTTIMEQ
jgi:hypothetical protein